jgi:hypothetical protein
MMHLHYFFEELAPRAPLRGGLPLFTRLPRRGFSRKLGAKGHKKRAGL